MHRAGRLALSATAGVIIVVSGIAVHGHVRRARATTRFAAVIEEANRTRVPSQLQSAQISRVPVAPVLVLVRDIAATATVPPYQVKTDLGWHVRFADAPSPTLLVLLVDRILVDVRSYRPAGEDLQVVLHCTLISWAEQRIVADYSVRGSPPSDRAGLLTIFGLVDRVGSEPWPEAGRQLASRLAH